MVKLARYLKPFLGLVLGAIILLFVQAMADLALPDYMSNIVNTGIQQSGIESAVPEAVRASQMDKLTVFMKDEDKNKVLGNYTLVDKTNPDYEDYVKDYPALTTESVYVLKDISKEETDRLEPIMGKAIISAAGIDQMKASAKDGFINWNGKPIPADTDLFALLKTRPWEERSAIIDTVTEKISVLGSNAVNQASTASIKKSMKL
jgi:hypothetical protein